MKLEFSLHIFEKYSNIKFHENLYNGSRDVPWGQTDGQTDRTKLTVAFRNFASAPKRKIIITMGWLCDFLCFLSFLLTFRLDYDN